MEILNKNIKSQIKDIGEKGIVVVAANAFNNVDAQKDVSLPGSFNSTRKIAMIFGFIIVLGHFKC